jgi:very-short-patch-repair endonuclease
MELATQQHGVISTRQLGQIGYSRSSAAKAARVGRLHRVHRGVYAVGQTRLTWEGQCLAAMLAAAPAVASHTSAGWLWGLLRTRPGTIHLTAPSKRGAKRRRFVVHSAVLSEADIGECGGIPVTAVPRTLLDLAAMLSPAHLERVIERAEEFGLFDLGPVEDMLVRAGGHPGQRRLQDALGIYQSEPAFTRSRLERRFLELVREVSLPQPAMNFNVDAYELDAYWGPERFAVELDVYETHGSRAAFERDRVRQDELLLLGVEMIRVTGPRLKREPKKVIERVAAHLERRRRELA